MIISPAFEVPFLTMKLEWAFTSVPNLNHVALLLYERLRAYGPQIRQPLQGIKRGQQTDGVVQESKFAFCIISDK